MKTKKFKKKFALRKMTIVDLENLNIFRIENGQIMVKGGPLGGQDPITMTILTYQKPHCQSFDKTGCDIGEESICC